MTAFGWSLSATLIVAAVAGTAFGHTELELAAQTALTLILLFEIRRSRYELVPLLRFAASVALAFGLGAEVAGLTTPLGLFCGVLSLGAWLLALRVPTPLLMLRGDVPYPGSIKVMLSLPFVLWPVLALFLLAPEMPGGQAQIALEAIFFSSLGVTAVSRLGRVGGRSFAWVVSGVLLGGSGWTLGVFDTALFAFTGGPTAALAASLGGIVWIVAGLVAPDGPQITEDALALAGEGDHPGGGSDSN